MNILVLGGTVFLGRHLVEAALARDHNVTLFNRGRHGADLFPQVEKIRGDREGDLGELGGREWDAVIDTSGTHPEVVRRSARALAERARHYTFISSVSVYRDFPSRGGVDESTPLRSVEAERTAPNEADIGPLKAASEGILEAAFAGRALFVRAGLIVGPYDPTNRFVYWPLRVAEGGQVLAPGDPDAPVQFVDVRDMASWTLGAMERRLTGAYNVTGREYVLSMEELLDVCRRLCGRCTFTWVADDFLLANGVAPRRELPLWSPYAPGAALVDTTKARAAGLTCQDVAATVHDTFMWASLHGNRPRPKQWLSREREREILLAWRHAQATLAVR